MGFKQKQLTGFGLIFVFMIVLVASTLFMVGNMKEKMLEMVEDRYAKVNMATEIRQLFYQIDQNNTLAFGEGVSDQTQIQNLYDKSQDYHQEIIQKSQSLYAILNKPKSKVFLNDVIEQHRNYMTIEKEIFRLSQDASNNLERAKLLEEQNETKAKLLKNINSFKSYQESLMVDAFKDANETYEEMNFFIALAVFVSIFGIVVTGYWVVRSTTTQLKGISSVMKSVDYEQLSSIPRASVNSKDEIGEIAVAFNEMAHSLETYNEKEKNYTSEIESQTWIQTRLAELATMYQRIEDIDILTTRFVSKIAPMVDASSAAFYLKQTDGNKVVYRKHATYADDNTDLGRLEFRVGEGLIGQAVLEKKQLLIEEVPNQYKLIKTGLGEVKPNSILIAPVLFENDVVGVIELATLTEFCPKQEQLLTLSLDTLGLTINSVQGRMEIERLLRETQVQAEELQTQSEELQTQSEELQAQSEELQSQSEEMRMINEQLEERNRDAEAKTAELEKTKAFLEKQAVQLKLASKYKSEFLANMSHELRTPLNSILILSDMMADEDMNEEQKEFARVINTSGKDLLSLINDILDLSKVEVGKLDVVFGEMNLSELPGLLHRNFQHIADSKGIQLNIKKSENVPEIFYTDEQRLQQIIKNLLSNAFKFTEKGAVEVSISQPSLDVVKQKWPSAKEGSWIEIAVTDSGIGIAEDQQELIFEAFQQVDGATMRKYGGTGLGLSICREFAKLLGGYIFAESVEGKGSTFTLRIPNLPDGMEKNEDTIIANQEVAVTVIENEVELDETNFSPVKAEMTPTVDLPALPSNLLRNKKVLVVDDDNRNIFALQHALEKEGMDIIAVQDGKSCLDILQKTEDIDVVLMDIMMPGMDGYETMRRIRVMPHFVELPIIALTAKAMKGDREKCLEAGASDYISKPLQLEQLLSVLRVWLAHPTKE
ncbi:MULTISPECIES: response regulator [unclassified Bacillus (in: firmicutes)]|uniref:response regulator n=1 Tax=unclassified Bacillus (in: firmicutes) TaxID=185979 RepID=UPI0008E9DB11|nr:MULTISPECIES: response regulator [unclassified Bacillus (in: firmicutes)]SFA87770.1 two-component system, chemotaxis family, sensor kinase CheA [Bacillus sp. UNCCL13]SFQ84399.1 two-component system, chemotaxis family, sensor kinase CheA [Bacillus sp. cl95]